MRGDLCAFILMSALAFSPAPASAFSDEATGFAINPGEPFIAQPVRHPSVDVAVGLTSTTGVPARAGSDPYLCQAGYQALGTNVSLSRDEINRLVDGGNWVGSARRTFERAFRIDHQKRFTLQDYKGVEFTGAPKGPGAGDAHAFISLIETEKGRVTMVCLTTGPDISKAMTDFRAIRSTINLPR